MAARHRTAAKRIVIWGRRPEVRLRLAEQPWVDSAPDTLAEAVEGSELVVLAAPVDKIIALAEQAARHVSPETIVTDVGSVKGELCRLCDAALAGHGHFVGSHPMAGSQKTGWENGSPDLFQGRVCFVTPLPQTHEPSVNKVARFWHQLGADVATVSPDQHDEIVAHISHLPQAVATSLCSFLAQKNASWRNYAGGGLRDTTRIAASDATMWIEIFQQNRDEVLRALRQFQDELHGMYSAIANREWTEVRARLERGKAYRDGFRP
ncbi:prephenate dehydrogenase/arogenate dehydrogenase family protein [Opitutaceae bacterium EW11]|nr:prephenate dehydrogenase/arogenate dehydrogenase family protein [Opitutaceae bacterium EW11]